MAQLNLVEGNIYRRTDLHADSVGRGKVEYPRRLGHPSYCFSLAMPACSMDTKMAGPTECSATLGKGRLDRCNGFVAMQPSETMRGTAKTFRYLKCSGSRDRTLGTWAHSLPQVGSTGKRRTETSNRGRR